MLPPAEISSLNTRSLVARKLQSNDLDFLVIIARRGLASWLRTRVDENVLAHIPGNSIDIVPCTRCQPALLG
jgi:hypothetical protein